MAALLVTALVACGGSDASKADDAFLASIKKADSTNGLTGATALRMGHAICNAVPKGRAAVIEVFSGSSLSPYNFGVIAGQAGNHLCPSNLPALKVDLGGEGPRKV